ncbi:MAG: hypothetical protein BWY06_01557 [Candidatus Latescibacteria bacterium ADurb.Bin168]|nr:MAG: hypothetical protein BWY06_01557 [Candidatus Latescibacteria bacterium ADurb.Bin168]
MVGRKRGGKVTCGLREDFPSKRREHYVARTDGLNRHGGPGVENPAPNHADEAFRGEVNRLPFPCCSAPVLRGKELLPQGFFRWQGAPGKPRVAKPGAQQRRLPLSGHADALQRLLGQPVAHADEVLLRIAGEIRRVDVPTGALDEHREESAAHLPFHRRQHAARPVGGDELVAEQHRVARKVDQTRHRAVRGGIPQRED